MTITAASANDGRNLLLRRTLSANDRAIVASPQEDGRRVFVSIARDIGVTEKTIRNRVRYLLDNQVIQIVAITSPTALGYHSGALLGSSPTLLSRFQVLRSRLPIFLRSTTSSLLQVVTHCWSRYWHMTCLR